MDINYISLVIAVAALAFTVWQFFHSTGRFKINLNIVDSNAAYGSIVNNKDHLMVKAVNLGTNPLVVKSIELKAPTRIINIFKRPTYKGRHFMDSPGITTTGGSFENEQQIDHGHTFKMLLELSSGVLVGHQSISAVYIPDSLGKTHKASYFQILKIKYQLYKQYPEWRERLQNA